MSVDSDYAMINRPENPGPDLHRWNQMLRTQSQCNVCCYEHNIEQLWGLRCKCRMIGISLSRPLNVYGNIKPVTTSLFRPELTLKKDLYFPSAITLYANQWQWRNHDWLAWERLITMPPCLLNQPLDLNDKSLWPELSVTYMMVKNRLIWPFWIDLN